MGERPQILAHRQFMVLGKRPVAVGCDDDVVDEPNAEHLARLNQSPGERAVFG
jgi:hypothetical protein